MCRLFSVFATGGNTIVKVFESFDKFLNKFLMSHITFNVILTITNAISKNLTFLGHKMASNYDVHSPPVINHS